MMGEPLDLAALRARLTTDSGLPAQGRATVAEMNIDRAIDELEAARASRGRCEKHRNDPGPSLYFDCCESERLRNGWRETSDKLHESERQLEAARAEIVAYRLRIENDAGRMERLRGLALDCARDLESRLRILHGSWGGNMDPSNEPALRRDMAPALAVYAELHPDNHEPPHPVPPTQAEANARDNERLRRETYEVPMNDPDDEVEYARRCR